MAWRNPRYGYTHAARDALVIATSANVVNERALADDRRADLCVSANDTKLEVDWDRVALYGPINRLWLSGVIESSAAQPVTISAVASDSPTFTATTTLVSDVIDGFDPAPKSYDFASNTQRYLRLTLSTSQQDTLALGEAIFTEMLDTVRGPQQGWTDQWISNRLTFQKESGSEYTLALGPDRRQIEYEYRLVQAAADFAVFEGLWNACGSYVPFVLDPAYDTTPGGEPQDPVWMRLEEDLRITQDTPIPQKAISLEGSYLLRMVEHLA